jgi:hypothetical protein
MERIDYGSDSQVPSWSWMACSGDIEFIKVEIGSVSWNDALTFDVERNSALIADVGEFRNCTMRPDGSYSTIFELSTSETEWIRYDTESDRVGDGNYCVVVGKTERSSLEEHYYILVVVPAREDGEYRRVAVGMVRSNRVRRLRADVRIV